MKGNKNNQAKGRNKRNHRTRPRRYVYYTGSSRNASDFEATTEYIINHVKGKFTDGNDILSYRRQDRSIY